jgi:hypothetical protein
VRIEVIIATMMIPLMPSIASAQFRCFPTDCFGPERYEVQCQEQLNEVSQLAWNDVRNRGPQFPARVRLRANMRERSL